MKHITVADRTLCGEKNTFGFKEKIEIARQLERLNVNAVELPAVENAKTDILLVRTISSFVKNAVLSVGAGLTDESVENAAAALSAAAHPRIRVELPLSTVGMEYVCHKKAPKMGEFITSRISAAKEKCADVEFCALDATRADLAFVKEMIETAVTAGATCVTVCDSAAEQMPDEFAAFIAKIRAAFEGKTAIGVQCSNKNGLAAANSILAVKNGAVTVKTAADDESAALDIFAGLIKNCGNTCGFSSDIKYTELNRTVKQIKWIMGEKRSERAAVLSEDSVIKLDEKDGKEAVDAAARELGYNLSDEDSEKVFEAFKRVAEKKKVGAKDLEAIIASTALQVPPTYTLISYVINNGNILPASAQITLHYEGENRQGISIGDGPIDAAFLAVEQITGRHYELDDFQIQSVTEGKEAVGSALVRLRSNGKLYSGNGISTDIIGASIRAYVNAINKIVYEEA